MRTKFYDFNKTISDVEGKDPLYIIEFELAKKCRNVKESEKNYPTKGEFFNTDVTSANFH